MKEIATRKSWQILPLPVQREQIQLTRQFSDLEYKHLLRGFIPEGMEDRWFIYMELDVLYIHRSWSGFCIFEVHLDPQHRVTEGWVNRDPGQYSTADPAYEEKMIQFLIDNLLLAMPDNINPE